MNRKLAYTSIARRRMGTDGGGVSTLVVCFNCPLDCRYCINPYTVRQSRRKEISVENLFKEVALDSIYFESTGGGVVFGGGEPMLQYRTIRQFIEYAKEIGIKHGYRTDLWQFRLETSMSVKAADLLTDLIDCYIVDVKDMNDEIYLKYTGNSSLVMKENLTKLASDPAVRDKVVIRLPLITGFNTEEDVDKSEEVVRSMGFQHINRFKYLLPNNINFKGGD